MKIHLVKTRLVNTYVVEYSDKILVVDVAIRCHRYVLGFIKHQLKRDISDIKLVVCSHDDPDHIGGIEALAMYSGANMAIPEFSKMPHHKILNDPFGIFIRMATMLLEGFRARMWSMYLNPKRTSKAKQQLKYQGSVLNTGKPSVYRLKDNQPLPGFEDWTTIHSPGHSWDSCCYFHGQNKCLVTGDTLLGSSKKGSVVTPSIYSNKKQMSDTLERLRELAPKIIYPGHGSIIDNGNF